jgi:hypothetical protein
MRDGKSSPLNPLVTLVHEFGHAAFQEGWTLPGPSNWAAVIAENNYRRLINPTGPVRVRHNRNDDRAHPSTWINSPHFGLI